MESRRRQIVGRSDLSTACAEKIANAAQEPVARGE
jgi:hypothetical protein